MKELLEMYPYLLKLFLPMILIVEFIKHQFGMKGKKIIIVALVLALLAVFSLGGAVYGSILTGIWTAILLTVVACGGVDFAKEMLPLVGTLKPKRTRTKSAKPATQI